MRKKNTITLINKHIDLKKKLIIETRKAYNDYWKNRIYNCGNNSKKIWGTINEVLNRKNKDQLSDHFVIDNEVTYDKKKIANGFNNYFSTIGPNLAKKIRPSKIHYSEYTKKYINGRNIPDFKIPTITSEKILYFARTLNDKRSQGPDQLSSYIMKIAAKTIPNHFASIINLSINNGFVHERFKATTISPIYKADDRTNLGNHRPIALINSCSKLLEKIVSYYVIKHLTANNIFFKNQFGFRPGYSVHHATLKMISIIQRQIDKKKSIGSLFIDLSKAFDLLNHDILFDKLEMYGIKGTYLKWFKSYFFNRKINTKYENELSNNVKLEVGVPQGSILGPLTFNIYVNDISSAIDTGDIILYADDTTLLISDDTTDLIAAKIKSEGDKLVDWFLSNKLSMNLKKTKTMYFNPKLSKNADQKLTLDNIEIEQIGESPELKTRSFKFLGYHIDEALSYKYHIEHIRKKANIGNFQLNKIKHALNPNTKVLIYFALIHSHLNFGSHLWIDSKKKNIKKLQIIQNKSIRAIHNLQYNAHTNIYKKNTIF
jgi:hypothetical protein